MEIPGVFFCGIVYGITQGVGYEIPTISEGIPSSALKVTSGIP